MCRGDRSLTLPRFPPQVLWGVIYSRTQELHDAKAVRLVQIMQIS
jgi:hypothetical protein